MKQAWPNAELVHLPVHASWLNQVEIYFSILQRKAIKPGNFTTSLTSPNAFMSFQDRDNLTATPFAWSYSRSDLNQLIARLDERNHSQAA